MFAASEINALVKLLGNAPVAKYSDAHALHPTITKLIKLGADLQSGGVLVHLTNLEAQAIDAARKAELLKGVEAELSGSQPPPGALEASRT